MHSLMSHFVSLIYPYSTVLRNTEYFYAEYDAEHQSINDCNVEATHSGIQRH
jgi:hypothetical protein